MGRSSSIIIPFPVVVKEARLYMVIGIGYLVYRNFFAEQGDDEDSIALTPFHNVVKWDMPQEEKDRISRIWMEKYVRTILLKSTSSAQDDPQQLITSRSSENLRRVIANEKGLLKQEDFDHLQKII